MKKQFKDFGIEPKQQLFTGDKIKIDRLLNVNITVLAYKIEPSKQKKGTNMMTIQIEKNNEKHVVFTGSVTLMDMIQQVPKDGFPFETTIIKESERLKFT